MADTAYDADPLPKRSPTKVRLPSFPTTRRVATRYEKTAQNYLAVITLAATILWLR